eukprot:6207270-Pleurochrysis_carterae.AAC.1
MSGAKGVQQAKLYSRHAGRCHGQCVHQLAAAYGSAAVRRSGTRRHESRSSTELDVTRHPN